MDKFIVTSTKLKIVRHESQGPIGPYHMWSFLSIMNCWAFRSREDLLWLPIRIVPQRSFLGQILKPLREQHLNRDGKIGENRLSGSSQMNKKAKTLKTTNWASFSPVSTIYNQQWKVSWIRSILTPIYIYINNSTNYSNRKCELCDPIKSKNIILLRSKNKNQTDWIERRSVMPQILLFSTNLFRYTTFEINHKTHFKT